MSKRRTHTIWVVLVGVTQTVVLALLMTMVAVTPASATVNAKNFNAGYIISDSRFYDSDAMTAAEVQTFLNSKVPTCHPEYDSDPSSIVCLKSYKTTSVTKAKDSYCAGYTGGKTQTAAQIIDGVARSCGVSQEVLLVLLQKENGLVTHTWPSPWRYKTAMGYGCPDTAACNSQYSGFFNQVYSAARQYRLYKAEPSSYQYRVGNNKIYWSPTTSCGYSTVTIKNQATAGLYNYTPYRPNQAALNAGYGTGNSCSSYGNRNFYLYYGDWFGDPTTEAPSSSATSTATASSKPTATQSSSPVIAGSTYFFSNSLQRTIAELTINYGKATDTTITGDWNGDGKDTLAVRRGSTYYFKNSLTGGAADSVLVYGKPTDEVLVGDWNGDGKDTLAVRRGSTYYFSNSLTGTVADSVLVYGKPTDEVLVGDWNGDSKDTLAVRR